MNISILSQSKKICQLETVGKMITKIIVTNKNIRTVNIAIVGKYVDLKDAYKSLGWSTNSMEVLDNNVKVNLIRIESDLAWKSQMKFKSKLNNVSGIIIPGGFGKRGTEGKIEACIKLCKD